MTKTKYIAHFHVPPIGQNFLLEDNGHAAYCYLYKQKDDSCKKNDDISSVIVYNRYGPIDWEEVAKFVSTPQPIVKDHASTEAICKDPSEHQWSILWSADSTSVALLKDMKPWCVLISNQHFGYSKAIAKDGPWGHPWDELRFQTTEWIGGNDFKMEKG